MQLPPNYGETYNKRFISIYKRVSETMDVATTNFILKNIGDHSELMQDDGIHPIEAAQSMMLDNVWQALHTQLSKN